MHGGYIYEYVEKQQGKDLQEDILIDGKILLKLILYNRMRHFVIVLLGS
jgi:hypothetical protein